MASEESHPAAFEPQPERWWSGLIRRKGHISDRNLMYLGIAACLPFLLILSRILALPWGDSLPLAGLGPMRALGAFLDQTITLEWVPPADRPSILYLLLLPTGALIIAFTRLTLGVRVLGLRAILLAIGFQAAGLVPSLSLMAVVVGTVILVRPWIRSARLPLFARIAVILCLSAMIMVGALLLAPQLGSEAVWSVAFFPVIIMAMLAEAVARTLEKDDTVMAVWRVGWTLFLSLVIALIGGAASRFSYRFPELLLTQLVMIVFISEFFDLRLLEKWPQRVSRLAAGMRPWYKPKPKVVVVRNRDLSGVVGQLGRRAPAHYRKQKIQKLLDALRSEGFDVSVLEADLKLPVELGRALPANPRFGTPSGIVFNLATGIQGRGRFAHAPAMMEMAGVPYTGPDPVAHAQMADRVALMAMLKGAEVPVPRSRLLVNASESVDFEFPVAVRPRFEPDARRIKARNRRSLRAAVRDIQDTWAQAAVVEEVVGGREIRVSLLGNEDVECLPLLEYSTKGRSKACPAPLEEDVAQRVRDCARAAFRAAQCRDYARVDIRLTQFSEPVVVDVKWVDVLARRGSFMNAAEVAGYSYPALLHRIVNVAAQRYVSDARMEEERKADSTVVSLADRRAAAG